MKTPNLVDAMRNFRGHDDQEHFIPMKGMDEMNIKINHPSIDALIKDLESGGKLSQLLESTYGLKRIGH